MQISPKLKFNSTSFTIQPNLNYDVIFAVPTIFEFSIFILRPSMIANIKNLMSIIKDSNFVINKKINFNNTVNININIINMVIHSTEKVTNQIFGRITSPEMPTKSISFILNSNLLIILTIPIFRIPTKRKPKIPIFIIVFF